MYVMFVAYRGLRADICCWHADRRLHYRSQLATTCSRQPSTKQNGGRHLNKLVYHVTDTEARRGGGASRSSRRRGALTFLGVRNGLPTHLPVRPGRYGISTRQAAYAPV